MRKGQERSVPAPTPVELTALLERIGHRVGHHLGRCGLLVRDAEQALHAGIVARTDQRAKVERLCRYVAQAGGGGAAAVADRAG